MKISTLAMIGLVVLSLTASTSAFAAKTAIAGFIVRAAAPLEALKFPGLGSFGNISLSTLPALDHLNLPLLGKGIPIPVVSSITVQDGATIVGSLALLQGFHR